MATLLEIDRVSKHFGAIRALDRVSFSLEAGEVHALVGENGAGKSTLVHILFGVVQPDRGVIRIAGAPTVIGGPREAQRLGIGIVFQELSLVGSLSVAENIYAGRAPARGGLVDWAALNARARALLEPLGLTIDPAAKVDSLHSGARQIVEIAKALSLEARILLLDEPTSALGPDDVVRLFALLRKLKARGIGIVYVSHRMPEIFAIGDRITILRDGRRVATHAARETDAETIVQEMVGREI
ncbi:MAG: ATP-binding cassette domain-containing protein, partial [Geminicoccaceae bacterium]